MRLPRLAAIVCLLPAMGPAQVRITAPGVPQASGRDSEARYGPPRVVDLDTILYDLGNQKRHVITEGEVEMFKPGQYWTLRDSGPTVLIIPGRNFDRTELDRVLGRKRIEVRGVVRRIRDKEYVKGVDLDLIEDPALPPMPPPGDVEPRISITLFAILDRTSPETTSRPEGGGYGRRILDEPSAHSGKNARIYGQFRGRNLFGDLPAGSARGKDDWVLMDGDTAIWVTGKAPKGDGWKLDLDYEGDSKNWLEVEGKPEVVNGVVYLKASKVYMAKAPSSKRPEPQPR